MCHSYRCATRWYEPFGESLSRLTTDGKNDVWIYTFELVIRLSRVKQLAIFLVSHVGRGRCVLKQFPAVSGNHLFWSSRDGRLQPRQHSFGSFKRQTAAIYMTFEVTGHPCRYGTSFFYGSWWGSIVHVIHLITDSCRWGWLECRGPLSLITNFACVVVASFH